MSTLPVRQVRKGKSKCRWSSIEDQLLLESISEFGAHNWKLIATKVPGRSSKQCRERWVGKLNPDIVSSEWTKSEDMMLNILHKELGNQWAKISKHIKGRSMIAVKNRWCCLERKMNRNIEVMSHHSIKAMIPRKIIEMPIEKPIEKPTTPEIKCDVDNNDSFMSLFNIDDQTLNDIDLFSNNDQFLFDTNDIF